MTSLIKQIFRLFHKKKIRKMEIIEITISKNPERWEWQWGKNEKRKIGKYEYKVGEYSVGGIDYGIFATKRIAKKIINLNFKNVSIRFRGYRYCMWGIRYSEPNKEIWVKASLKQVKQNNSENSSLGYIYFK
ncbi:MAG: hypothetical protein AB1567_04555 [bacterium]